MPNSLGFLPHPMHYYLSSSEQMKQHYATAVSNNNSPMFSIDNILAPRPLIPQRSSPASAYYPHSLHPATAFHPATAMAAAHSADIMQGMFRISHTLTGQYLV